MCISAGASERTVTAYSPANVRRTDRPLHNSLAKGRLGAWVSMSKPQSRPPTALRPRASSDGAAKTRTPLTLDHIVTTAIDLIEAEGPDALSMRRLATRLGSSPMATYHHVADRQALMEAIAQHVVAELNTVSDEATEEPSRNSKLGWAEPVRVNARASLVLSRRYPATFAALLRSRPTTLVSAVLGVSSDLMAAGLDEADARMVVRTITRYVMGTVMGEGAAARSGLSREELDESFEFGIEALLDGMARRLA